MDWFEEDAVDTREPATVKADMYQQADWDALREKGAISKLHLTRGEVDDAFEGTEGRRWDTAPEGGRDDTFINLYATYLNTPTTGRNLLGQEHYQQLMDRLDEGEHAIMLMADGRYSFKGTGFVRGGIFDRFQINQKDASIQFRTRTWSGHRISSLTTCPHLGKGHFHCSRAEPV